MGRSPRLCPPCTQQNRVSTNGAEGVFPSSTRTCGGNSAGPAAAFPDLRFEDPFVYNDVIKDVHYSDIISARPGAVDVTFRYRKSRICASSSKTAVRTQQRFVLFPDVNCVIQGHLLSLFFCMEQLPACTGKGGPPSRRETALLLPGQRHQHKRAYQGLEL